MIHNHNMNICIFAINILLKKINCDFPFYKFFLVLFRKSFFNLFFLIHITFFLSLSKAPPPPRCFCLEDPLIYPGLKIYQNSSSNVEGKG